MTADIFWIALTVIVGLVAVYFILKKLAIWAFGVLFSWVLNHL